MEISSDSTIFSIFSKLLYSMDIYNPCWIVFKAQLLILFYSYKRALISSQMSKYLIH